MAQPTILLFGEFLRETRVAQGLTQTELAKLATDQLRLTVSGSISQNTIAQYEREKIFPTLPKVVAIAWVLNIDYFALVLRVTYSQFRQSAYQAESLQPQLKTELQAQRVKLLLAALHPFPKIGEVQSEKLELIQLQTKALIVEKTEVLGLEGIVEWQANFPDLQEFWVCNLYWLDAKIPALAEVTRQHLQNGCRYVYFVPSRDVQPDGKLTGFIQRLSSDLGFDVSPQITTVIVKEGELPRVRLDFVVANPQKGRNGAVAFSNLRYSGTSKAYSSDVSFVQYSFRMDPETLISNIRALEEFGKHQKRPIGSLRPPANLNKIAR
jgi:transcriptional regulator with XRE-family HTH domain